MVTLAGYDLKMILASTRAALIGIPLLLTQWVTAQIPAERNAPLESRINCTILTASSKWRENHDTLIQVRLKNLTDQELNSEISATLYLTPISKLNSFSFWSPIDLAHDAPAPTEETSMGKGAAVSIKLRRQKVHLQPNGELEFTIHASKMKWQRQISSIWPNLDLLKTAPGGDYLLRLSLDTAIGRTDSNQVRVLIDKNQTQKSGS